MVPPYYVTHTLDVTGAAAAAVVVVVVAVAILTCIPVFTFPLVLN